MGWVVPLAYLAFAYSLWRLVSNERIIVRAGDEGLPGMAVMTMAVAIMSYNVSYLIVTDLYALILIATSVHSLQYHLISWRRNYGRFYTGDCYAEAASQPLLARLSRRHGFGWYALFFLMAGAVLAHAETMLLGIVPLTFVFQHFYMDGILWKGKRNPTLAMDLGLAGVGRGA
jgi:hypothetical protein